MTRVKAQLRKKGRDISPEEKLRHHASKLISRETKKIRAFLLQRLVKRCRKLRGGNGAKKGEGAGDDDENDKERHDEAAAADMPVEGEEVSGPLKACLDEIQAVKGLPTEAVVKVCLRRLGLKPAPSKDEEGQQDKGDEEEEEPGSSKGQGEDEEDEEDEDEDGTGPLMLIVEHTRMKELLKDLAQRARKRPGKKATTKRKDGDSEGYHRHGQGGGQGPGSRKRPLTGPQFHTSSNKAVFVESLSGRVPRRPPKQEEGEGAGDDDDMDIYGYKSCAPPVRKNRPGQRARRARAEAEEARLGGGGYHHGGGGGGGGYGRGGRPESAGGGRKRPWGQEDGGGYQGRTGDRDTEGRRHPVAAPDGKARQSRGAPPPVSASSNAAINGGDKLHPSWAAKQAQKAKEGIAQFVGKKITFDD